MLGTGGLYEEQSEEQSEERNYSSEEEIAPKTMHLYRGILVSIHPCFNASLFSSIHVSMHPYSSMLSSMFSSVLQWQYWMRCGSCATTI